MYFSFCLLEYSVWNFYRCSAGSLELAQLIQITGTRSLCHIYKHTQLNACGDFVLFI